MPFSSIPQRRIDIVHTSLYALPPYSQALRASIPGGKGFREPKSLCRLKLQRSHLSANWPPTVGDSHPGYFRCNTILIRGLHSSDRNWYAHLTKVNRATHASRCVLAMPVPKKFATTPALATLRWQFGRRYSRHSNPGRGGQLIDSPATAGLSRPIGSKVIRAF